MTETQLYNRQGQERRLNRTDESGVVFYAYVDVCRRCGGIGGGEQWRHTGWTCFECDGSGKGKLVTEKLYTAEKLAKLNATAEKRNAKKLAVAVEKAAIVATEAAVRREAFEAANADVLAWLRAQPENNEFASSLLHRVEREAALSCGQIAAVRNRIALDTEREVKRAASDYVGSIKDRITAQVKVERVYQFERTSFGGYGYEVVSIVTMRDAAGNALVSKSARFYRKEGDELTIKATVKDHTEYRGERQTLIERVAVL